MPLSLNLNLKTLKYYLVLILKSEIYFSKEEEKDKRHLAGSNKVSNMGSKLNLANSENESLQSTRLGSHFEADDIKLIKYDKKTDAPLKLESKAWRLTINLNLN